MRAVVYQGPEDLQVQEADDPVPSAGDVLVTVDSVGVCGTDVRIFKGQHSAYARSPARIPGHEIVGRVLALGEQATGLQFDQRVFVAPNMGCGHCKQCLSGNENLCPDTAGLGITLAGGFAEQLLVPARAVAAGNLIPLAESTDPDVAVLIEPLACVLRGQDKAAVSVGDIVLVAGGGPVGLLHVALAAARGAALVICSEPSPVRREAATRAGAGAVIDPNAEELAAVVGGLTGGEGPDVVITAAPVHALQAAAVELAAVRGRVLLFGGLPRSRPTVEINTNAVHYKELTVVGTTASSRSDCQRATALIENELSGLAWMVSDRLGLDQFAEAIARVQNSSALKVVLNPGKHVR